MAVFRRVSKFDADEEEQTYAEHLGYYFTVNGISEDTMKEGAFLSCYGKQTYKLLQSVMAHKNPQEFSYGNIV